MRGFLFYSASFAAFCLFAFFSFCGALEAFLLTFPMNAAPFHCFAILFHRRPPVCKNFLLIPEIIQAVLNFYR
ncbi:hypothetical protein DCCM_0563 [Desulfocucumis palustris]|uniref:Uncharacterized protein n=1 Tax=Desulfocucumis palustris TaxID=1898651 RepID=A0A2L2X851_9FIRM|nr:hypothetical protein DCCM_0563 [Desulfocucumis palustris]